MAKPVIFAEKPSQAKAYAEAFKVANKSKHHIELMPSATFPNGATITWGVGHLVELKQPAEYTPEWKKWRMDVLPMIPEKYEFKVAKGKWDQFKAVKSLFKEADYLINACDVDREGSNIFYSILKETHTKSKPIQRLWINSLEADEIRKGFESLRDNERDYRMYIEAQTRQISDWLVGMNASRLFTILLKSKGLNETMSVGRVQSPTVYMIYERQVEIDQFVPENFYELKGEFHSRMGTYTGKADFKSKKYEDALATLQKAGIEEKRKITAIVKTVDKKPKKISPPKLHSLSTLQQKANRIWKYSPAKVLEVAQQLYEKKLISYPRSDCQYITNAEFDYLKQQLPKYQELMNKPFKATLLAPNSRYVNSKKVEEHYAIIPTKSIPSAQKLGGLSPMEKNIYAEIMRSTLAIFHRDYTYEETKIVTMVNTLPFKTTGKVEIDRGFQELWPTPTDKKNEAPPLPQLSEGEDVDAVVQIHQGTTQPPKLFTEGQLVQMMKTCGKLVEDESDSEILKAIEGIGTEATRASIIETIKRHDYIDVTKNIVTITEKGKVLCQAISGSLLASPTMTAKWETYLKKISDGTGTQEAFLNNIEKFLNHLITASPSIVNNTDITAAAELAEPVVKGPIALCPACHKGNIVEKKSFYGCSAYNDGCKFTLSKKIASKKISAAHVKDLCDKGITKPIKGFKSKKGSTFSARLKLATDKIEFDFSV
ncbi:type IA DNA topoisomerase [Kurthia sibirica]|uniref:DNA topoisomerase n=1 Tax=Kurthia sibirica TaxID=202750 RepID=A0A2U3ALJ4_9BACL|nr:type IA DNA topoisomerase [Kurthia sibirica]PWI25394.1 type IA DNA topoisomerase [Kurthia sibirica]GEK34588.1 DNA topoisomerase [Kurthia sibirica]